MTTGSPAVQQRNSEMVDLLSADFQKRYESAFAWSRVIGMHQMLPMLRGFWPFSSVDEAGNVHDMSCQVRPLIHNGSATFGVTGLIPYADLIPGSSDFYYRGTEVGLEITGALTYGGWFNFDVLARTEVLMGKWNDAGVSQASFLMLKGAAPNIQCYVSGDGAVAIFTVSGASTTLTAGGWFFCVARYTPSTELALFVNNVKTTNTTAVPAALFNSTASFIVGAYDEGTALYLDGKTCLCFVCGSVLSDATIGALWEHSRPLFGR